MLHQSLPLNSIIGAWASFAASLREEEPNLMDLEMPAAALLSDLMEQAGVPRNVIGMVLTQEELAVLGNGAQDDAQALCQICGVEEARQLVDHRGSWLLLCDDDAHKLICKKGGKA